MATRVQSSPFRETEFDQRLDRMLDDLKSSVTDDEDSRRTPLGIRSSSRSSSRAGSIGRRGGSVVSEGVADGGRLTHHRKEYTSPDQSVKTVAETYQYDSGDTHPSGQFQKKVVKSTYSSYNVDGGLSAELQALKRGPTDREMEQALSQESRNILTNADWTPPSKSNSKVVDASQEVARELVGALSCIGKDGRLLSNGHMDDDMIAHDEKGGEVRRIVWRNRYEKTFETQDSSTPTVSIEKDARNRRYNTSTGNDMNEVTNISSLTRPHVPPQISPGGQSWVDPVPLPTPPQISPREPGVAYIYNYGTSGGSAVQPLPPLNYVAVAPPNAEGAPSPTPSGTTPGQPVIYHYSYHYTIQPGQPLPDGAHPPSSPPPALQIVPPPASGYSQSSNIVKNSTTINEIKQTSANRDIRNHTTTRTVTDGDPGYPGDGRPRYPGDKPSGSTKVNYTINTSDYKTETHHHPFPTSPADKEPRDHPRRSMSPPDRYIADPSRSPNDSDRFPNDPNRNITININKTTTTRTTHSTRDGGSYPPGDGQPLTSTPYRGRSRSPERRYPHDTRYPSGPSDSLERVRRNPQPGLPFPETSSVKYHDSSHIPRKVDELMSDFPERNGGPHRPGYRGHPDSEPLLTGTDETRTTTRDVNLPPPERNEINTMSPAKIREEREKTKNLAGPPVYYPPGHENFNETMHTMTLKEGGRRGKAKWRREAASGYKESSSHSESKGGMTMVPIGVPLCCGAACSIM